MVENSKRRSLIKKIEKIRNSKVITYIVGDREGINTQILTTDIRELIRHFKGIKKGDKVDLFVYGLGGDSSVAWALSNLIRSYTSDFNILIPFKAFSCFTSIALGANEIIMHKAGILGPVDPSVANHFNPRIENRVTPISVEDIGGYRSLIKDKFDIKDQHNVTKAFESLSANVHPLALGNAYRHYIKSRDDTKKILELHFDKQKEKEKIEKIVDLLVEKLYYHGHHINRNEAEEIGLKIKFAEDESKDSENLADVMWELFEEYENELQLTKPYKDELPTTGNVREISVKFVESSDLTSVNVIGQQMVDMDLPDGSKIVNLNGQPGVCVLNGTEKLPPGSTIPLLFQGGPLEINGKIYDKRERIFWKTSPFK